MAPVNSASVALAAVHCGASDYLNKPFTVDELASSLERAGGQPCDILPAGQLAGDPGLLDMPARCKAIVLGT